MLLQFKVEQKYTQIIIKYIFHVIYVIDKNTLKNV